jgi:hypothetical protein
MQLSRSLSACDRIEVVDVAVCSTVFFILCMAAFFLSKLHHHETSLHKVQPLSMLMDEPYAAATTYFAKLLESSNRDEEIMDWINGKMLLDEDNEDNYSNRQQIKGFKFRKRNLSDSSWAMKITDSPNLTYSTAEWKKASDVLIHRHHLEYCFETNDSISELTLLEEEIRQAMIVSSAVSSSAIAMERKASSPSSSSLLQISYLPMIQECKSVDSIHYNLDGETFFGKRQIVIFYSRLNHSTEVMF